MGYSIWECIVYKLAYGICVYYQVVYGYLGVYSVLYIVYTWTHTLSAHTLVSQGE